MNWIVFWSWVVFVFCAVGIANSIERAGKNVVASIESLRLVLSGQQRGAPAQDRCSRDESALDRHAMVIATAILFAKDERERVRGIKTAQEILKDVNGNTGLRF